MSHTHDWSTAWTTDDTHHWHECTSEAGTCDATENAQKGGYGEHVFNGGSTCATCGYTIPHTHDWSTDWTTDDTHHWHECTSEAGTCDITENAQKDGYGEHVYDNSTDYACNVCNYTIEHTHEWSETWTANSTHHWHKCVSSAGACNVTQNTDMDGYSPHVYDGDTDSNCNSCGYERVITPPAPGPGPDEPGPGHKPDYKFDTDTTAFVSGVVSLFDRVVKAALGFPVFLFFGSVAVFLICFAIFQRLYSDGKRRR